MSLQGSVRDVVLTAIVSALIITSGTLAFSLVESPSIGSERVQVVTTFYPLFFFASEIGGQRADVMQLMPDNAEPHAWEPKPSDLLKTDRAAVFVYNGAGFEPWAESFLSSLVSRKLVIVDTSRNIDIPSTDGTGNGGSGDQSDPLDPHFWLDPMRAKIQVDNILTGFITADGRNTSYYEGNAQALKSKLDRLDQDFVLGLNNRTKNDIITTHEGFDYMAIRYHLNAHAAVGISADQQPSPQDMVRLTRIVQDLGLHYVFSEPVFSDSVVRTIARETGAQVLVLDGVHGRTGAHAGMDYFQIMYDNLRNLRVGLEVTDL